jgi:hypothetical protein
MKPFFHRTVRFQGDPRFLGKRGEKPYTVETSPTELARAYTELFRSKGKEWREVLKKIEPTLSVARERGKPFQSVETNDWVYDLRFREALKGKRRGLDEAVIFVWRKVGDRYLIVSHYFD